MRGRDQASTTQQAIMESPQFARVLQQVVEISSVQYHSQPSLATVVKVQFIFMNATSYGPG
jgi:hypothetical protein